MRNMSPNLIAATIVLLGSALSSNQASAVSLDRAEFLTAVSACKGATSADSDKLVYYVGVGVTNSASSPATIICAFSEDFVGSAGSTLVSLTLVNPTNKKVTFNCTLVADPDSTGYPSMSLPKSLKLHALNAGGMSWTGEEVDPTGGKMRFAQVSCELPAGTQFQNMTRLYQENVGL